ncbi:MAG: serine acetyltransferase [Prevotella sp.]|nr:serine acetyltransferase [Candidatus Prevotella equi]
MSILRYLGGVELEEDCQRIKQIRRQSLVRLFLRFPEFRYQFYYRMRLHSVLWRILLKPLSPFNMLNLYINCRNIGGGLMFQHGFSTDIGCRSIGRNCIINQMVTVGYNNSSDCPIIGNDVHLCTGAKVIGNVTIGDDVIVGANAVVVKDVPSHSIVAGIPAKVIKTRKDMKSEWEKVNS